MLLAIMHKCLCFVVVVLLDVAVTQQADILLEESAIVTEAVGPAGGVARLPCDVTPAATSDRLALVIWYKQGHEAPIYSYDSRHEVSHWSDPGTLGSRATFQVNAQPAVLILDHLRAEDSGQYRCRVDFIVSPTKNSRINLTVLIPPDKLLVLNDAGTELSKGVLGPYNEGTSVNVTCVAVGGRPTAKVSWWKSHALLASSEARSTINLHITRQDLGQEISCQAVTDPSMPPKTKVLEVDVNLKPLWVRLQGARRPLIAGQLTELICQVVGARPKPSISWWKGGTRLKGFRETTSSDGNMTTSVLSIVPVLSDAGRVISCRAVQPSLTDSIKEDGWKLEIQHTPVVNLELGSNLDAGNIVEGSDVYLDCRIKANPWHHHVYFTHNGIPVRPGPGVIVANQSLVLQGVSRPKAGIYICAARNQLGEGSSNELILNVKFAPKCRSDRATVIRAARGEVVSINCLLDANPIDTVTYRWWFNSSSHTKMLLNHKGNYATDHTGAELQYNISGSSDYGWIQCAGKNSVGDQMEPCNYQILPADKPSPLTSCEVLNVTLSTLSLTCIAGHDGGTKQRFLLQAYDMSTGFLLRNMSSDTPNFTVEGLPGGAALSVSVRAFNRQGASDAATMTTNTLKAPERQHAGGSPIVVQLTPLLACVAGVAASLVALSVCVVAIIRCNHRSAERRNNRNDSSDENNKNRQDDSTKMPLNASTNADSVDSLDSSHITSGGDYGTIRPLIPSRRLEPDYSMNKTPSFVYEKLKIDTKGYRDRNDQYIQLRPLDSRLPHVVNQNMYGPQYVGSMINDNLAVKYHTGTLDRRFNDRINVGNAYPEYILSPDAMVPNPGLYINHNAVRPLYRDDQQQQMLNDGTSLYSKNHVQNQPDSVFHLENRLHTMPSVIDRRPGSGDGSLIGMDPCVSQASLQLPTFSFTTEANNFSGNSSENCSRQQPVIQETKT